MYTDISLAYPQYAKIIRTHLMFSKVLTHEDEDGFLWHFPLSLNFMTRSVPKVLWFLITFVDKSENKGFKLIQNI